MLMDKPNNNEKNPFEKQIDELNEWQENSSNPGHYVGTGKVPLPVKNMYKSPFAIIFLGIIMLLPTILNLINDFTLLTVYNNLLGSILGCVFIFAGVSRLLNKRRLK